MILTMRIESVASQPDRAGRHAVRFDDGTTMRLYSQTIQDFCLYTGKELSEADMNCLREAAGAMSAKMRAVRIVAASNVSKQDLEQRLVRKGEDPIQAKEAVQWMSDLQLVDDRKTAEQIVQKCINKGYGLSRARQALYEKRIPKEYWDEVLIDYPDQIEAIVAYLKAHLGEANDTRMLRKVVDALLRRGHSYQQIRRGLDQISVDFKELPEG